MLPPPSIARRSRRIGASEIRFVFQGGRLAVWEDKKIIVEELLEVDAAVEVAVVTVLGGKATT